MKARRALLAGILLAIGISAAPASPAIPGLAAADLPARLTDQQFWELVEAFSEPGGTFHSDNFVSNEGRYQLVIPTLVTRARPGRLYIGVGPEQNFTYLAVLQPKLSFVIDIRRDNMVEHLMYKALFEISKDRADFLSRLFARKRPSGLNGNSSVKALFDAYQNVEADSSFYEQNLRAVLDRLVNTHGFPLSGADKDAVTRMMNTFRTAGPSGLKGSGDKNATYAQLMTSADLTGRNQSYLASEENFRIVQKLERQNLIVPLVGDFAGDKAIQSIAGYLKERRAVVDVFYVSNVERYLFDQGAHGRQFYSNVAALPLAPSSVFIRSVTRDISRRLGIPIPEAPTNWWSYIFPINDCLKAFTDGKLQTYRNLFPL